MPISNPVCPRSSSSFIFLFRAVNRNTLSRENFIIVRVPSFIITILLKIRIVISLAVLQDYILHLYNSFPIHR